MQPLLLIAQQGQRPFHGDPLEADFVARAQLAEPPEIRRDHVGRFGRLLRLLRPRFVSLLGPLLLLLLLLWLLLLRPRLLSLLGPLLLLLSGLCLRLLFCLLLLWLCLRVLLFIVFFLRVRRDKRPEKQKQGSDVSNSNELHCNRLLRVAIGSARRRPVRPTYAPPALLLPDRKSV